MYMTQAVPARDDVMTQLETLRRQQDAIDGKILAAIAERVAMRRKISALRISNDMPTMDEARMKTVLNAVEEQALALGVPAEMALDVFSVLIDWSHKMDKEWRNNPSLLDMKDK